MILNFGNDIANVKFTPEKDIEVTTYTIKIFASNKPAGGDKKHVYTSKSYNLHKNGENIFFVTIDYWYYNVVAKKIAGTGSVLPNIIEFSFEIVLGDCEVEVPDVYEVHFVRYMPDILNILGWSNGEKLQRIWFTNPVNNSKEKVDPKVDILSWDWVTKESKEVKEEFDEFFLKIILNLRSRSSNNSKKILKSEIKKMISDNIVSLPTSSNPITHFDPFSKKIIIYKNSRFPEGERMPFYEKYYFDHKPFSGVWDLGKHFLRDGFDDFVAALANFNFHVVAKGDLQYIKAGFFSDAYTNVKIKKLAFYIKDNWDFIDKPNEEQPLGFWKITSKKNIEVDDDPDNTKEYFKVTNKDYRNYRDVHKMGYNYHLYSTLHIEDLDSKSLNIEFKL